MSLHFILFVSGLIILYVGGELFIRGSSKTARIFGIKPLIIGVVIVAFATSSPEFFVSILAVIRKSQDLAIGNIVGSCIANIGLVLGMAALLRPITIKVSILRRELPILFAVTFIFFAICLDFRISRPEALLLCVSFALFIFYCIKNAKEEKGESTPFGVTKTPSKPQAFWFLIVGLAGLLLGAHLIVDSSVNLARYFGISEVVIGLTAVAIGTSLPELAASLISSARGECDISIGNVIGSNIFNILGVIGIVCLIRPITVEANILFLSLPLLLLYTLGLAPILKTGLKISRIEGAILLASYSLYLYLIFRR